MSKTSNWRDPSNSERRVADARAMLAARAAERARTAQERTAAAAEALAYYEANKAANDRSGHAHRPSTKIPKVRRR